MRHMSHTTTTAKTSNTPSSRCGLGRRRGAGGGVSTLQKKDACKTSEGVSPLQKKNARYAENDGMAGVRSNCYYSV